MSKEALIMVSIVWTVVPLITGYFFYKVLTAPKKVESENETSDEEFE